jgi:hypothetical protein
MIKKIRINLAQRLQVNQKNIRTIRAYIVLDLARMIFRAKYLSYTLRFLQ